MKHGNFSLMKYVIFLCVLLSVTDVYAYGPCQKWYPKGIAYLPKVSECGNTAAIAAWGDYYNLFSVVVRDCNNGDRDPCHGGTNSCGTNQSSPFKVQKILTAKLKYRSRTLNGKVHCLKESGLSEVYKLVRRITVKLKNPVTSPSDVVKICLNSRTKASASISIKSVQSVRVLPVYGWTPVCATQGYLNCTLTYKAICPQY